MNLLMNRFPDGARLILSVLAKRSSVSAAVASAVSCHGERAAPVPHMAA